MNVSPSPRLRPFRRSVFLLLLVAGCVAPALRASEAGDELRLVIAVTRHGVRSPLYGNDVLGKFADQPWPQWSVPPGYLTPHGRQQMVLMGAYYRTLYASEGLLTGDATVDQARVFFRSDSDQRTTETAHDLAKGLLPSVTIDPHARPLDQLDPLFRAAKLPIGHPNLQLGVAAVLGRIGGDAAIVSQACAPAFETLHRVLLGKSAALLPGKVEVCDLPASIEPGATDHVVAMKGPLRTAMQITDNLMLEYAEGMPLSEVGWGRLSRAELTQLMQLHSLYFGLTDGTFYPAQAQGSNLASHILKTMDQAATGRADPGAFGTPGHRLVILVAHDTNIINLGGLMGLSWWLPGTQANPLLPGGALIFELRQRRSDRQFTVRAYYLSQSLDQIRTLEPLTLKNPPGHAPIFIPGASEAGPGFPAPLRRFQELLQRVIDPEFVLPDPS
jgi:4-phytase/acid phosphatase